ncbi:MAG: sigma-70 family RNA polymerase sigma factor, partial [Actinomycetota bacterium]|nr:sigma-70 family RNA polymerase sigma factor [Actinomycetota bacterium]
MEDAALVLAARAGDRDALAAIYDRYADRLHDYCWSILRDRDEAADAFHEAFVVAAQRLGQLRDPEKLRPWLYAIARHESLRRAKARGRQKPTAELADMTAGSAEPEERVRREESVRLVWDAAAGLAERDRALLDLNLRHGLEGQELADAFGVERGHAYVLLNRLRGQVERSLGALLVARYGRADCPELARLLAGWDGRFSPLVRKRVARHADQCETCADRRRTMASPLALLSAVPLVPAPAALRDRTLDDAQLVAHTSPAFSSDDGFPPSAQPRPWARTATKRPTAVLAVLAVVGAALTLLLRPWSGIDERLPVALVEQPTAPGILPTNPPTTLPATETLPPDSTGPGVIATTQPTTSTPGSTGPPVIAAPRLRLLTTTVEFGETATRRALELSNDGGALLVWAAESTVDAFAIDPTAGSLGAGATTRLT